MNATTTPAVAVDLAHRVGDFELSATFAVERGLAVLFGPSGAGKSLTLSLIAGLRRPDRGTIAIQGRPVADAASGLHVSTQDRRVGMVFQDGHLLPHRTVRDNVALAVRQTSGRGERRSIADGWLRRVGAAELADRRPRSLSGGQRQRVALARALAGDPALLLLDEPLSSLDLTVRRDLRRVVREVITDTGVPSLFVTHDPEEADELGDLMVELEPGRVTGTRRLRPTEDEP